MNTPATYISSKLLTGDSELLRQHSLTRWMSRDLMQAAADFCRNLGLVPAYCDFARPPDPLSFLEAPQEAVIEVRWGRTKDLFEELDRANREKNRRLLSLHINESDVYSAVSGFPRTILRRERLFWQRTASRPPKDVIRKSRAENYEHAKMDNIENVRIDEAPDGALPLCPSCKKDLDTIWVKSSGLGLKGQKEILMCPHCKSSLGYSAWKR